MITLRIWLEKIVISTILFRKVGEEFLISYAVKILKEAISYEIA